MSRGWKLEAGSRKLEAGSWKLSWVMLIYVKITESESVLFLLEVREYEKRRMHIMA